MNRLADETSPYLRQHRDNPVDWYPWGSEAFAAARERNVPVLLSVGYSSCHWCHVMAHECFEDDEVAAKMNAKFVNVKVDREERPDVDALYMDAVQAQTGRGGWPMTVFLTPGGEPFYGGTFFPKPTFLQLLDAIDDVYRNRPDDIAQNVNGLVTAIDRTARVQPATDAPGLDKLNAVVQGLARAFDTEWGGFGGAPKFPPPLQVELILRAFMTNAAEPAARIVATTLDAMCSGGLYDHVGGGFHRYATDREWKIPHFEKMLYDQALLVPIYLRSMMVLGKPQWRQVVEETVEYVRREMHHPAGGWFSAQDADSPDPDGNVIEGGYTTWTPAEVRTALSDVDRATVEEVLEWYDITDEGHLDGRSIPNRAAHRGELARSHTVDEARRQLLAARLRRTPPGLDDKVLTEWNALWLAALAQAGACFGRRDWLDDAIATAEFLIRELRGPDGRWFRSWQADGSPPARHAALAGDHAALVDAFIRLAEATGEARWISEAVATADTMLDWFWDPVQGGLDTTAGDAEQLIVRQKDLTDGAIPSANAIAANALFRLSALTGEPRYANHGDRILQLVAGQIADKPNGNHAGALLATDLRRRGLTEVVIVGERDDLVRFAHTVWRPDVVLAWGEPYESPLWEGRADGLAYICRQYTCQTPQDTLQGFAEQYVGRPVVIRGPGSADGPTNVPGG